MGTKQHIKVPHTDASSVPSKSPLQNAFWTFPYFTLHVRRNPKTTKYTVWFLDFYCVTKYA